MLELRRTEIEGVIEILPKRIGDDRGFFSEVWNQAAWREAGIDLDFVQDNHSSSARGVLRGLHYQLPPAAQAKLVRVSRGAIFDVAVDIRRSSPTFGRWVGRILSADAWNQLLVPAGLAHGFLALEDGTEVQYKVDAPYSAAHDCSLAADDPALAIAWPMPRDLWVRSDKDLGAPTLAAAQVFDR